jgi:hypothetical protein
MSARFSSMFVVLLVWSSCARQPEPTPVAPALQQQAVAEADLAARETALLVATLHPDGTAELLDVTVKPVPFRRHHLHTDQGLKGAAPHVLEVEREGVAFTVPLDLGAPGEGGGDVMDRWADGSVVLRAPYLGQGTQYALVRLGDARVVLSRRVR